MAVYRPTIGLEIHAELKTITKMFCGCRNDPDERQPNRNICPVCMAHPGTLPVINKEAVHKTLLVGSALGGTLATYSEFDRKNYFYPDIPKGYQISQYAYPLVLGGTLAGVPITRVHLEEDTARSQHEGEKSLIDYNRAGVPLMELVTEPAIHTAAQASNFARELQLLLRYLSVGEANMEKGEMRVEANISLSTNDTLGTKVEIKNINSFRSVEKAIAYEIERQSAVLEKGDIVLQETRGWDDIRQITFSQRKKESSHDYRYFPDPDLPKLLISDIEDFSLEHLTAQLGELPAQRRVRYHSLGLKPDDADMFVREPLFGNFFDVVLKRATPELTLLAANYLASDIAGKYERKEMQENWLVDRSNAKRFSTLMEMVIEGKLSSRGAKDTLALMLRSTENPEELAAHNNLLQESNTAALSTIVAKILKEQPQVALEYKSGKGSALQFLVGQAMKESAGRANPATLIELIQEALKV